VIRWYIFLFVFFVITISLNGVQGLGEPPEGEEPEEIDPMMFAFMGGVVFGAAFFWVMNALTESPQPSHLEDKNLKLRKRLEEYKNKCGSLECDLQDARDEIKQLHEAVVDVVVQDVQGEDKNIEVGTRVDNFPGKHLYELHYDKGMSYREIMILTGINVGTIKSRINRYKSSIA